MSEPAVSAGEVAGGSTVTGARDVGGRLDRLVVLQRRFPAWAVWVDGTGRWTATRARPYRPGNPFQPPLLWVFASDCAGLVARMRESDDA